MTTDPLRVLLLGGSAAGRTRISRTLRGELPALAVAHAGTAFLPKPFRPDVLAREVRRVLEGRARE